MLSKRKEINVMKVILYKYRFKWLDSETKTLNNAGLHLTIIIVSMVKSQLKTKVRTEVKENILEVRISSLMQLDTCLNFTE